MALTITHTFAAGSDAIGSQVNTNFSDVVTWANSSAVTADGNTAMTGFLTLRAESPTADSHAARKKYVNDQDTAAIVTARARAVQRVSMTAGNITLNSTAAVTIPGATTLSIAAASGDLVLLTATGQYGNAAVASELDFKTISTYAFNSAFATTNAAGYPGWACLGGGYQVFGGSLLYQLVAGDVVGGLATFIPYYKTFTAAALTLYASTTDANPPFHYSVVNLGAGA